MTNPGGPPPKPKEKTVSKRKPSMAKTSMALLSYVLAAVAIVMAMNLAAAGDAGQALLGASLGVFLIVAARKGSR